MHESSGGEGLVTPGKSQVGTDVLSNTGKGSLASLERYVRPSVKYVDD